jgi:hypothetical protein
MKLITSSDTYFKPSAADSSKIPSDQMALVKARTEWPVLAYRVEAGHICFTLDYGKVDLKALHPSGKNTWWAWQGALEDPAGHGPNNKPKDEVPGGPTKDRGASFTLPGFSETFYSNDPISAKAPNFTWAEALHFSGYTYRRPSSAQIVRQVIASAEVMQEVRARLGNKSITINSWYRDPESNRRAGGASRSRHMEGDAIDFRVAGMTPAQVYATLNDWWGARGGLASSSVFTHLDCRGARARWSYGF